jgi:hypothetical protein
MASESVPRHGPSRLPFDCEIEIGGGAAEGVPLLVSAPADSRGLDDGSFEVSIYITMHPPAYQSPRLSHSLTSPTSPAHLTELPSPRTERIPALIASS